MSTPTITTTTEVCGKPYTRKVGKNKVERRYNCTKVKGHDQGPNKSNHGQSTNVKKIELTAGVDESFEMAPQTERLTLATRERDEQQAKFDARVMAVHQAWVNAGKPDHKNAKDIPQGRYQVKPSDVEGAKALIRKSGEFLGFRTQIGPPVPVLDQESQKPTGNLWLYFAVFDKPAKETPAEARAAAGTGETRTPPAPAA